MSTKRTGWTWGGRVKIGGAALAAVLVFVAGMALFGAFAADTPQARSAEFDVQTGLLGWIMFGSSPGEILYPGESREETHKDWSELVAFDQGLLAPALTVGSPGAAAGRPQLEDIIVVKQLDSTGPKLQKAAASGEIIPCVVIEIAKPGETAQVFYRYTLSNAVVTRYNVGTTGQRDLTTGGQPKVEAAFFSATGAPTEEIALAYQKLLVEYRMQKEDGSMGPWIAFLWDGTRAR